MHSLAESHATNRDRFRPPASLAILSRVSESSTTGGVLAEIP